MGEFHWVGFYGGVSRLAVVVKIRHDSKHACFSRGWITILGPRLLPAGATGMGLSLTSAAANTFALVLGRVLGRQVLRLRER